MKRKSMVAIIVSFAMVGMAIGVIATDTAPIELNGTGTATVNNAGPNITALAIEDGTDWVTSLDVNTEYYFYVNVTDSNTLDDLTLITLELWVPGYQASNTPTYRYKFIYTETAQHDGVFAGTWAQIYPTAGAYLNAGACATPSLTTDFSGSYVFAFYMERSAKAGSWSFNASVTDISSNKMTIPAKAFTVYKYLEMTYDTGGGSMDFTWIGATGAVDLADTFTVTTTSNTQYTLAMAYENRFTNVSTGTTWNNEPSLQVRYSTSPPVTLTNVTGGYANWTSFNIPIIGHVTSHTIYLDYEGVLPALTYTGVTIYIRASV